MKDDVKIDFNSDWKMVTILIGHNDLCSIGKKHAFCGCKNHECVSTNFLNKDFVKLISD